MSFLTQPPPKIIGPAHVEPPGSTFLMLRVALLMAIVLLVASVLSIVITLIRQRRDPDRRSRARGARMFGGLGVVAALGIWWFLPGPFTVPRFPALPPVLPTDTFAYRTVGDLPVAARSPSWIDALGHRPINAYFGSQPDLAAVYGIPFNLADSSTPMEPVTLHMYKQGSYPGPYPMTDPAYIQTMPIYQYDDHYVVVDLDRRQVWELFMARRWFGRWNADSGAHFSMDSADYPRGHTIAAGLPILPGLITYADVASGRVGHVSYAVSPVSRSFTWPARTSDGPSTDPDAPPQGVWLRLKPDADLSKLGPQARVVAAGLQEYGTLIVDTAPGFGFYGTPDARWHDDDLRTLSTLSTDDFEVVDPAAVIVDADSMAVRPPG